MVSFLLIPAFIFQSRFIKYSELGPLIAAFKLHLQRASGKLNPSKLHQPTQSCPNSVDGPRYANVEHEDE